jgi:outer membrane beta-barrel protein
MTKSLIIVLALLGSYSHLTFADEIEFPEEELARESTLPVFEKQRAVLNRTVITDKHFELGVGGGLEMNEPYYNDYMFQAMGTYNFTERSAVNVLGLMWMDGLSDYGEKLKKGRKPPATNPFPAFDASKAPHPKFALFANYEFIAYYGKISISKQSVMNLNTFAVAGLGYINMDSINTVGLNLGVGQNFFLTKNFGLRADLRWLIFQGPDPTSVAPLDPQKNYTPGQFGDHINYNGQLSLTAIVVL